MQPLTKADLLGLIPHSGSMCLVDSVLAWTASHIVCASGCHRDKHNPLMTGDVLPAICGVELAAQAIAAHIALTAPLSRQSFIGVLGGVTNVELHVSSLETIEGDLEIMGTCLHAQERAFIYRFSLNGEGRRLVAGRASIFIQQVATQ